MSKELKQGAEKTEILGKWSQALELKEVTMLL